MHVDDYAPPRRVAAASEPERISGVVHGPVRQQEADPVSPDTQLANLLQQHYTIVWRTLRRIGVPEDRVDDAAQETFIIASRKLDSIQAGRERKYLLGTAIRVAANYRRTASLRHEVVDDHALTEHRDSIPSAEQLLDQKRMRQTLDDIMDGFAPELRTVFVLFELEGLSAPEIAELTRVKVGTVASRLRRARELFQVAVQRLKARRDFQGGEQ